MYRPLVRWWSGHGAETRRASAAALALTSGSCATAAGETAPPEPPGDPPPQPARDSAATAMAAAAAGRRGARLSVSNAGDKKRGRISVRGRTVGLLVAPMPQTAGRGRPATLSQRSK